MALLLPDPVCWRGAGRGLSRNLFIMTFILEVSFLCHIAPPPRSPGRVLSDHLPSQKVEIKSEDPRSLGFTSPLCHSLTYVTLGKSLKLSVPQFPHLQNEDPIVGVIDKIKCTSLF